MTNLEGRIILRHRVKAPPAGVWTDNQVLKALADRLGHGRHFTANARETFEAAPGDGGSNRRLFRRDL